MMFDLVWADKHQVPDSVLRMTETVILWSFFLVL